MAQTASMEGWNTLRCSQIVTEGTAFACADSRTVAGLGTLAARSTSLFASCGSGIAQGLPRLDTRLGTCHIAHLEFGARVCIVLCCIDMFGAKILTFAVICTPEIQETFCFYSIGEW